MRKLSALSLLLAGTQFAAAHTLEGEATLQQEITHQLTGAHHLPALLLLVLVVAILLRTSRRRRPDINRGTHP